MLVFGALSKLGSCHACAPSKINFEVDCLFENAYALQSMSAIFFFTLSKMNVLYPIGKIADMKVNLLS